MSTASPEFLLRLSPINQAKLKTQIESLAQLKLNVSAIQEAFNSYAKCGSNLVDCIAKLGDGFSVFEKSEGDPTLSAISSLLKSLQATQQKYFAKIASDVITPISSFISNEIAEAEAAGVKANNDYTNYIHLLDLHASQGEKLMPGISQQTGLLMTAHWAAVSSSFSLMRRLEIVDRKKIIETTTILLAFFSITSTTYRECVQSIDSQSEKFLELQSALPETTDHINAFNQGTARLSRSLEGFFNTYWGRIKTQFPGTNSLEHEGYLWRMSTGLKTKWKRKYFICKGHVLAFYKPVGRGWEPEGVVKILLASVKRTPNQKGFCFSVVTQDQTLVLQALFEWDMLEWINVIQNNIQFLIDNSGQKADPATDAFISRAQKNPHNLVCADCGAPNPGWCSINFGVYICIQCGGIHRSMTSSVSKVRSLTMDILDQPVLDLLEKLGNEKANTILEANLKVAKPGPGATKEAKEEFIIKKYIDRAFASHYSGEADIMEAISRRDIDCVYAAICQGQIRFVSGTFTALHQAGAKGNGEIALLLGLNSPDVNILDHCGWSALSYAAYYGNDEVVNALLLIGGQPDASPNANPYLISLYTKRTTTSNILLPYWRGPKNPQVPEFKLPPAQAEVI